MSGDLPVGAQLPPTQQMLAHYSTSPATVQRALASLEDEGFIDRKPGRGIYVRDRQSFIVRVSAYFAPTPRGYSYKLLDVGEVRPPVDAAKVLELNNGMTAILRHRLMSHDGVPVELSWSYYPLQLATGTPLAGRAKIPGGAPRVLADLGYPQLYFRDYISSRAPTTEELEALEMPDNVPVMRQFRMVYSHNDQPVEVTVMIKPAHLYELEYQEIITPSPED